MKIQGSFIDKVSADFSFLWPGFDAIKYTAYLIPLEN